MLAQHLSREQRHPPDVVPRNARLRIEIDAQLVGMIEVLRAHRMRMQIDAAEIDDPRQLCRVAQHDLARGAAGRELELDHFDPERPRFGRALLEEEFPLGAVDVAFERHRPAAGPPQRALGDGEVVADQIDLGDAALWKEDLLRIRDRDLAAFDLQQLLARRHAFQHTDVR